MDSNNVWIIGRLGRDPQIRVTSKGTAVASFSMASGREWNGKTLTDWNNVVAWGRLAEAAGNLLKKGSEVIIHGRIGTRKYTAKDGSDRYITEVTADFIGKSIVPPASGSGLSTFGQFGTPEPDTGARSDTSEQIPF